MEPWRISALAIVTILTVWPSVGGAAEGFALDVEPRDLRERTDAWQVQDLSVGESGYTRGFALCAQDGSLFVPGVAALTERSEFLSSLRVTVKPGRRVAIEIVPDKTAGRVKPEALDFVSRLARCDLYEERAYLAAPLFLVDSINGHESLSALLAALDESSGAPEADATDPSGKLAEILAEIRKEEERRGGGGEPLPEWRISESRSKIDDSPSVFMSLDAVERIVARFGWQRPSMHIRCNENTTSVYFIVEDYLSDDRASVTYRLDGGKAKTKNMPVSTDGKAFGLWRGATAIPFLRGLFGKERMVVRVTPRNSGPRTFEFALGPLEEEIGPLAEACHWRAGGKKSTAAAPADAPAEQSKEEEVFDRLLNSMDTEEKPKPREKTQIATILGTRLTVSEVDAVRRQFEKCWNVPIGARNPEELVVEIKVRVNRDRTVRDAEIVDQARAASDRLFRAMAESAHRAVMNPTCSPLKVPPDKYDAWKEMTVVFDPSGMVGR